jgi:hypothetical protein
MVDQINRKTLPFFPAPLISGPIRAILNAEDTAKE